MARSDLNYKAHDFTAVHIAFVSEVISAIELRKLAYSNILKILPPKK